MNAVNKAGETASRLEECKSFVSSRTITSYVYTSTSTTASFTITSISTLPAQLLGKRQASLPAGIPTWASNCKSNAGTEAVIRFSSACSCAYRSAGLEPYSMKSKTETVTLTTESFSTTTTTTTTTTGCPTTPLPASIRLKVATVLQKSNAGASPTEVAGSPLKGSYVSVDSTSGLNFGLIKEPCAAAVFFSNVKPIGPGPKQIGPLYLDRTAKAIPVNFGVSVSDQRFLSAGITGQLAAGSLASKWESRYGRIRTFNSEGPKAIFDLLYYTSGDKQGKIVGSQSGYDHVPVKIVLQWEPAP
ncbi:uncharacterized protein DFL_005226 [Arthrobotrys flagrans]|uniref:Uncharacterized protein n=1 Tax=Arthrobotrys flagrans TaxID=97331 RepID=A0A437A783_ARTFL|nr:hypothetical protein DFL_005226 [Arthrobotrys flagrans]